MTHLLKRIFFTLLLTFCCGASFAQDKSLQVNAPAMVSIGKPFQVEYSIGIRPEKIISPSFDGFELLAGPTYYESLSVQIVDGTRTESQKHSYTYVLIARNPGIFKIPAASVIAEGKTYTSKAIPIEVVTGDPSQGRAAASGRNDDRAKPQTASIPADAVLLRAIVSPTKVYKGQPVRLSFKLYTRIPCYFEGTKIPSFNGFWSQELPVDQYKPQREQYNGKVYDTRIVGEYLLYPQQTGTLQIEPLTMEGVVQVINRRPSQSAMDDIFGTVADVQEVHKKIASQPVNITVNDFPAYAPSSFSGAVGNFTMTADIPKGTINVNSSATYTIRLTGAGNLPFIQAPKIEMPPSFEQYNPKTTESFNKTINGISGYRQFEYPFIARAEGDYGIDPVEFTFFNPETSEYVTLSTDAFSLHVLSDTTGGSVAGVMMTGLTKEDLKIIGNDIRFIKLDAPKLRAKDTLLMFSPAYFMAVGLVIGGFIFMLLYLPRRIAQRRDADMMRGKRANKVVLARLKIADQYMKEGNDRGFQDEMLKALWGYMSDKLNIPVANLTKENVRQELLKRGIPADTIMRYIDIISECEYAQYSPAESMKTGEIYRTAVEVISKMESYIRK